MKTTGDKPMKDKNTEVKLIDDLRKPSEVAGRLQVHNSWIYQKIHAGSLPFPYVKVGRYVRIPASGVEEYLRRQLRGE